MISLIDLLCCRQWISSTSLTSVHFKSFQVYTFSIVSSQKCFVQCFIGCMRNSNFCVCSFFVILNKCGLSHGFGLIFEYVLLLLIFEKQELFMWVDYWFFCLVKLSGSFNSWSLIWCFCLCVQKFKKTGIFIL